MTATATEPERAQAFAKAVKDELLLMRGYKQDALAPRHVVADVFKVMSQCDGLYSRGFASALDPKVTATAIQHEVWETAWNNR